MMAVLSGDQGEVWAAAEALAARHGAAALRDMAVEVHLPVALPGEAEAIDLAMPGGSHVPRRVVDLSALWAGPLCAGLLARQGAEVWRVESVGRPDPTGASSPRLDAFLNGGKTRVQLDLREPAGKAELWRMIERADVLVTSARAPALGRLGIVPERFAGLTMVAITGHGLIGAGAMRVGFGDDCAVAGGLVEAGGDGPRFLGDALADPLTGLEAALAVLAGRTGLIDMAMAGVAAAYARMIKPA
jgi:crotonobetainyl-CoA:carnitine CoA-transferase CaiB-like acyl-CoA transferase